MASPNNTCLDGFPIRADIAGPGVRVAFYVQTLSTILFVWLSPKDVSSSHWSMVSTALGLSVAGIITGIRREISLIDALVIIDAVLLAFYACDFMNSEFVVRMKSVALLHRRPSALWIICSTLASLLSCCLGLYVWSTALTFGSAWNECNDTLTVTFLGLSLQEGRKVQLGIWSFNALLFVRRTWIHRMLLWDAILELLLRRVKPIPNNLELLAKLSKEKPPFWADFKIRERRIRVPQVLIRNFDLIWALVFVSSTIISTEAMVRKYKTDNNLDTQWNFGQVLPVLLTLAPVFSLIDAVWALFKSMNNDLRERDRASAFAHLQFGSIHRSQVAKVVIASRLALAQQFSATLFLGLWCAPLFRKEMAGTLNMTGGDLKVLEALVCEAYERWDIAGRTGDLDDAWDGNDSDDDDGLKFNSIYFDTSSHTPDDRARSQTSKGCQFAAILWDALHATPGLKHQLFKSRVVVNETQLQSLKVVVAQTWDLWEAHRDRTKRFRWWIKLNSQRTRDIRTGLASTNKRVVGPAVPNSFRIKHQI